jgi:hypothetical protein
MFKIQNYNISKDSELYSNLTKYTHNPESSMNDIKDDNIKIKIDCIKFDFPHKKYYFKEEPLVVRIPPKLLRTPPNSLIDRNVNITSDDCQKSFLLSHYYTINLGLKNEVCILKGESSIFNETLFKFHGDNLNNDFSYKVFVDRNYKPYIADFTKRISITLLPNSKLISLHNLTFAKSCSLRMDHDSKIEIRKNNITFEKDSFIEETALNATSEEVFNPLDLISPYTIVNNNLVAVSTVQPIAKPSIKKVIFSKKFTITHNGTKSLNIITEKEEEKALSSELNLTIKDLEEIQKKLGLLDKTLPKKLDKYLKLKNIASEDLIIAEDGYQISSKLIEGELFRDDSIHKAMPYLINICNNLGADDYNMNSDNYFMRLPIDVIGYIFSFVGIDGVEIN